MKDLKLILAGIVTVGLVLFSLSTARATLYFSFDTNTENWQAEDWGYGVPALQWVDWDQNSDPASGTLEANTSSLSLNADNWAKFYLKGDLSSPADLTTTPVYTLDIYLPDTISGLAKLGVRTGSGWDLYESDEIVLTSGWQTLSWNMTGVSNLNDTRQLGIELQAYFPPAGDTFNIDNVAATPIPEPASLISLGAGLIGIFSIGIRRKGVK